MEEEKKSNLKEPELKIYFAQYSQDLPPELESLFKTPLSCQQTIALQEYQLEIIEAPKICLNIDSNIGDSFHSEVVCKVFEINVQALRKFISENDPKTDSLEFLKEKEKIKDFKVMFSSQNDKIQLIGVGFHKNFPLLSTCFVEPKIIIDIFEEPSKEKEVRMFFEAFVEFLKNDLDRMAFEHYLKKILFKTQIEEKSRKMIDIVLEGMPMVSESKEKDQKLLFQLKTKDFYGSKMLELPKFNKETGNFEAGEKIKLVL